MPAENTITNTNSARGRIPIQIHRISQKKKKKNPEPFDFLYSLLHTTLFCPALMRRVFYASSKIWSFFFFPGEINLQICSSERLKVFSHIRTKLWHFTSPPDFTLRRRYSRLLVSNFYPKFSHVSGAQRSGALSVKSDSQMNRLFCERLFGESLA